jgi:hydrogenase-4 transcriptional activator
VIIVTVNKDEFFIEMTLRICSSLDINIALGRVFEYLQRYLPLGGLSLAIADTCIGAGRHIASIAKGTPPSVSIYPVSKEVWDWVCELQKPIILSVSSQDYHIRALALLVKLDGDSGINVPLWVESELIGFLTLRAKGAEKFTPNHVELLEVVAKPFAIALANAINHEAVLKHRDTLIDDNRFLNRQLLSLTWNEIIGGNSGLRNVKEMIQQVASQNTTVLIEGETGTGKELIANAIHFASPRKEGPFIKLNCGAIPENLIDDELFGHEKGAFTGAVAEKRGRFERANGGTLFLDEIGELPLQCQVRLLRVLESKKFSRVGGERLITVDVRVIVATHRNLKQMVSENRFREDLWFRLNVFPIIVPPLRQRQDDVPALLRYFVIKKSRELGISVPPPIAPGAYDRLTSYGWPGNVRELGNLVERELICHGGGQLRFDSLLPCDKGSETVHAPEGTFGGTLNLDEAMSLHIGKVLKMTKGKIHGSGGAAELLGINPNTLRGRMHKLGIMYRNKKAGL